jgi:hypothetical protein
VVSTLFFGCQTTRPGQIFSNNFLNNRQFLKRLNNGLFNCSRSTAHAHGVLKIENSVPCDMSLWSNGGNTGVNNPTTSPQSLLEVLKAP